MRKLLFFTGIMILFIGCIPSPRYKYLTGGGSKKNADINGKTSGYVPPKSEKSYDDQQKDAREEYKNTGKHEMTGEASWYGPGFHGKTTANGERFNQNDMTAAHKTLPFNTKVKVTDLDTKKSIVVRINDRGPYAKGRIIDLSKKAAEKLGSKDKGHANVKLEIVR